MDKKEILKALNFRHATKEFDESKKISDEDFDIILETARLSPSSMGIEPWKFMVIQNKEVREELAKVSWGGKKQIPSASHLILAFSRTAQDLKYDSEYIDSLLRETKKFPAEVTQMMKDIMKSIEETRLPNDDLILHYSREQTFIALGNMMTVASLLEIDTCAIGGFDYDAVTRILKERNLIDTDRYNLTCMLALGYRKVEPAPKTRREMNEVVEWVK